MFSTADIWHTSTIVPKRKVEDFILKLHELGICQLKKVENFSRENYRQGELEKVREFERRISFIEEQFKPFEIKPVENLIKELFIPKKPEQIKVNLLSDKQIISEVEKLLDEIEPKVRDVIKKISNLEKEKREKIFLLENISYFPNLKLNEFKDTEHLKIINGLVLKENVKKLILELKDKCCFLLHEANERIFISIIMLKEDYPKIEAILHKIGFEELKVLYEEKTPLEIAEELVLEIKKIENEIEKLHKELERLHKIYSLKIDRLKEELNVLKERLEAFEFIGASDSFILVESWMPKENLEKFNKLVKEFKCFCILAEREDAPTILKNPGIIKPFEIITNLYSLPKYKRVDPTPVLALSYALFFGFMLTDAIYGALLAAIGLLMMYGIGKYNEGLKNFGKLILILGIFTALLGVTFGSYCGDILQKLGIKVPMLLDPMKDVMSVIGIAFVLAFLHQLIGLSIGLYENFKYNKFLEGISTQLTRLCFLIGAAIALLIKPLILIGIFAIIAAIIVHVIANCKKNNIAMGLLSIFDFSGLVGDLCSYSRLAALAVGTAGIALAVNFMALLVNDMIPFIGIIIAIGVFIVGHLFNMAMNGLGAFIHSIRLHFLEFFQKFYEGGGYAYQPFIAKRKKYITEVE